MHDILIVGGGAAGLTAAMYLGRFRRPTLVVDGGRSRVKWIPESHNVPGFSDGVRGVEFLSTMKSQAQQYGATVTNGSIQSIVRGDAGFSAAVEGVWIQARYVLLATGVEDTLPPLGGAEEAVLRSVLRTCPICDGFEAIDKRIAVIGSGVRGEQEADFLRRYSNDVTYIHVGRDLDGARKLRIKEKKIDLIETEMNTLVIGENGLEVRRPRATRRVFDVFYAALGCRPRTELAASLGAVSDENGALRVNAHQQTTVDRLYAAGDNVRGLNQIVIAAAEAALAATDIHNRLRQAGR